MRAGLETRLGDVTDPASLRAALDGVDAVVHLVGLPRDLTGGRDLDRVNTEGTRNVLAAMAETGVRRLVHLGALGVADDPTLHYASSKARAEALVAASGPRLDDPQAVAPWGERDGFFNIVADLVRWSPGIVPVPGNGRSRFQPLAVRRPRPRSPDEPRGRGACRPSARARRASLLDVSRDHRRGLPGDGPRAGRSCRCRSRSSGSWPGRPRSSTCRSPSRPTSSPAQARQHRPARVVRLGVRLRAAGHGGQPGLSSAPQGSPGAGPGLRCDDARSAPRRAVSVRRLDARGRSHARACPRRGRSAHTTSGPGAGSADPRRGGLAAAGRAPRAWGSRDRQRHEPAAGRRRPA